MSIRLCASRRTSSTIQGHSLAEVQGVNHFEHGRSAGSSALNGLGRPVRAARWDNPLPSASTRERGRLRQDPAIAESLSGRTLGVSLRCFGTGSGCREESTEMSRTKPRQFPPSRRACAKPRLSRQGNTKPPPPSYAPPPSMFAPEALSSAPCFHLPSIRGRGSRSRLELSCPEPRVSV